LFQNHCSSRSATNHTKKGVAAVPQNRVPTHRKIEVEAHGWTSSDAIQETQEEQTGIYGADRPYSGQTTLLNYIEGLDDNKADLLDEIGNGKFWRVRDDAISLLSEFGVSGEAVDEDSTAFHKLCEGLLRAQIKDLEFHKLSHQARRSRRDA
jgi:hypothetical protein